MIVTTRTIRNVGITARKQVTMNGINVMMVIPVNATTKDGSSAPPIIIIIIINAGTTTNIVLLVNGTNMTVNVVTAMGMVHGRIVKIQSPTVKNAGPMTNIMLLVNGTKMTVNVAIVIGTAHGRIVKICTTMIVKLSVRSLLHLNQVCLFCLR